MNRNFNQKPYVSGRLRAHLAILLLAAAAAISMLSMLWNITLVAMIGGKLGAAYDIADSATDMLYLGLVFLHSAIFIATAIVFLIWLHRAYRNLPALGAVGLNTTPGWAVGYFFIPFVNFIKPFQVVMEIWHESTPGSGIHESFGGYSPSSRTPPLVAWWWTLWIIANIAILASEQVLNPARTIEDVSLALWLLTASHALFVVAAVLAILVVKRIDEMQEAKFTQLGVQGPPPPPDSFETLQTACRDAEW
ncbi:MAG TPA: DUF4328 domain-containing protein [Pyrinomonadaceae bacterium]|nr:DUF4328 domain-containing protein [Pyrinomonadaceae bacterium]